MSLRVYILPDKECSVVPLSGSNVLTTDNIWTLPVPSESKPSASFVLMGKASNDYSAEMAKLVVPISWIQPASLVSQSFPMKVFNNFLPPIYLFATFHFSPAGNTGFDVPVGKLLVEPLWPSLQEAFAAQKPVQPVYSQPASNYNQQRPVSAPHPGQFCPYPMQPYPYPQQFAPYPAPYPNCYGYPPYPGFYPPQHPQQVPQRQVVQKQPQQETSSIPPSQSKQVREVPSEDIIPDQNSNPEVESKASGEESQPPAQPQQQPRQTVQLQQQPRQTVQFQQQPRQVVQPQQQLRQTVHHQQPLRNQYQYPGNRYPPYPQQYPVQPPYPAQQPYPFCPYPYPPYPYHNGYGYPYYQPPYPAAARVQSPNQPQVRQTANESPEAVKNKYPPPPFHPDLGYPCEGYKPPRASADRSQTRQSKQQNKSKQKSVKKVDVSSVGYSVPSPADEQKSPSKPKANGFQQLDESQVVSSSLLIPTISYQRPDNSSFHGNEFQSMQQLNPNQEVNAVPVFRNSTRQDGNVAKVPSSTDSIGYPLLENRRVNSQYDQDEITTVVVPETPVIETVEMETDQERDDYYDDTFLPQYEI